jgi:hypothetical protein
VCDSAGPPPNQPDDNRFRQRDDPGGPLAFNRDEGHKTGQEEKNVSVDNTLNSRKPGLDELVPSRYALQVGDIEVLVISDGVLPIAGKTIAYNADSADLASWLDDQFLPPDVLEWPLNVAWCVAATGRYSSTLG